MANGAYDPNFDWSDDPNVVGPPVGYGYPATSYSGGGNANMGQRIAIGQQRRMAGGGGRGAVAPKQTTAGTDIPESDDLSRSPGSAPTAVSIDASGGVPTDRSQPTVGGPGSNYPTEASRRYEQLINNAPEPTKGARRVFGEILNQIGAFGNQPAISNLGTRLSWQANPNTPGGPSTPEAYNATLARARLLSQLSESTQQTAYLNQIRKQNANRLAQQSKDEEADRKQRILDAEESKYSTFQAGTRAVQPLGFNDPNTGRFVGNPATATQTQQSGLGISVPPSPSLLLPPTGGPPPATSPTYPTSDPRGELLTQKIPGTTQTETRLKPSAATLASEKAAEGKSPLSAGEKDAAVGAGMDPNALYSDEEKRQLRTSMLKVPTAATRQPNEYTDFREGYLAKHPNAGKDEIANAYAQARKVPGTGPDRGQNFVDPASGRLVRVEPGGQVPAGALTPSGFSTTNTPTAQTRAMSEMANTVTQQVPSLLAEVDALRPKLGPGAGRWNQLWTNKAGLDDPDFAALDTDLDLFSSALVRTHFGGRGGQQYREALRKQFSEAQSPDDLKARIQHADNWIKGYAAAGQSKNAPANAPAKGAAATSSPGNDPMGLRQLIGK